MEGTNGDAKMSSSARNEGSELLWGEGVSFANGSPALRGREVIRGLRLYKASSTRWDVHTVSSGVLARKGSGGIAQGGVLLKQRGVGCKKRKTTDVGKSHAAPTVFPTA